MEDFNLSYPIQRRKTIEVKVGDVGIGGDNPVRVQSMTNTDTMDTEATARQVMSLVDCGCEIVRITASEIDTARNLYNIKNFLVKHNYNVPLVADIHFNPKAAEEAAKIVEKVRINPGNYVDKKSNEVKTEEEYKEILEKAKENILPLIDICKNHHTAIRIGVNHGSLSQRIINKYGNTPYAMAMSAMEFLRMFNEMDFNQIVISMKASDTKVMNYSNRLLVDMMNKENMMFPIHLGVTEAGGGEDGRIKSISGISSLLSLGIGDTIRVSLTEKPENEIPVAKDIVRSYSYINDKEVLNPLTHLEPETLSLNSSYKKQYLDWEKKEGKEINLNKIRVDKVLYSSLKDKQPLTLTYDKQDKDITKIIGDSATLLMEGVVKDLHFQR
jgi:(E)-4-hydroxy-3-methylbut-2-enyl-diphosphate synthase